MAEADPPAQAPAPGKLPRGRFWLAVLAGVALGALFIALAGWSFGGRARDSWPAYAVALPLAAALAVAIGRRLWARAGAAILSAGLAAALVAWLALLSLSSALGHCDYTPTEATWKEPGLYADLGAREAGGVVGDAVRATWVPPQGALPFNATVPGQPVAASLVRVSWEGPAGLRAGLTLDRDGAVSSMAPEDVDNGTMLEAFLAFTGNVTSAPAAERVAWGEAFLASARDAGIVEAEPRPDGSWRERRFVQRSVEVPGPFRLEDHARESGARWSEGQGARPTHASAEAPGVSFEFSLPGWRLDWSGEEHTPGDAYTLLVDPLDRVVLEGPFREGDGTAEVEARTRSFLAAAGVAAPRLEGFQDHGYVC